MKIRTHNKYSSIGTAVTNQMDVNNASICSLATSKLKIKNKWLYNFITKLIVQTNEILSNIKIAIGAAQLASKPLPKLAPKLRTNCPLNFNNK
jgi:hypothetical protein